MKNPNNPIGKRTRDLPASRPGPQPTAPPSYIETLYSFLKSDGDILNAATLHTLDAG
jgi:lysozyme family protein